MMLAIDVGNTHITCAFMEGDEILLLRRVPTEACLSRKAFVGLLEPGEARLVDRIALCSVRRPVREIICRDCLEKLGVAPFVVTNATPMGITTSYGTLDTLGTDRLVDAAACFHLYCRGTSPGIVIDMGTATTVDYITEEGVFQGGAIAPGLVSAYRGLRACAPELPEIDISPVGELIGTTTVECMRTGVIAGHAALVSELAALMTRSRGTDPIVVVTGGFSGVIGNLLPERFIRDEHLTLKGLSIIHSLNIKDR